MSLSPRSDTYLEWKSDIKIKICLHTIFISVMECR